MTASWLAAEVLPRASHESRGRLSAARAAIEEQRYADAVRTLDTLLRNDDEGFTAVAADGGSGQPVKAAATALLASLPGRAIAQYETWVGPQAQQALREAIARRDRTALAAVAEQYPCATAGAQAVILLGCDALDRGHPLEALGWLRRLARLPAVAQRFEPQRSLTTAMAWLAAGREDRALETIQDLAALGSKVHFRIGDEEYSCSDAPERILAGLSGSLGPPQAAPTNDNWSLFRGDAARNAPTVFSGSLGPLRWLVDAEQGRKPSEVQTAMHRRIPSSPKVQLPSAHPLVVDDLVLARMPGRLMALDAEGGRQMWEFPPGGDTALDDAPQDTFPRGGGSLRDVLLWQRTYQDALYGQLASDGHRVFLVDGLGSAWGRRIPVVVGVGGRPAIRPAPVSHNRLVALQFSGQGKLAWSVGGTSGEDEPELAGAFFLGAPLPVGERLFALAELDGEIVLCALHSDSGQLEWSRVLAVPPQGILDDSQRRLAGASPSLADGVLVCPTSAGAVVAVDIGTRSILWGYEFPPAMRSGRARQLRVVGGVPVQLDRSGPSNSIDATATIADGCVVLAPVEAGELVCLDLDSGELVWRREAGDILYVGCVQQNTVLVVCTAGLAAWDLASGKPAWDEWNVALPDGARPAGRGLYADGFYYLPTNASEIVKINLDDGRIVQRIHTESPPGNLVAHGRLLVWQSPDAVEAFDGDLPPDAGTPASQ